MVVCLQGKEQNCIVLNVMRLLIQRISQLAQHVELLLWSNVLSTFILGILDFILLCVFSSSEFNNDKLLLIPGIIGCFLFISALRFLKFKSGIAKVILIIGLFISAFDGGAALLLYIF